MLKIISDNYDKFIGFSFLSLYSSYIYCWFYKKNAIHIYYTPGYISWMFVTCMFFAKKIYDIKNDE